MTKISALTSITAAEIDSAADLVAVVDMSEVGAARDKKMTIAELETAVAPAASINAQTGTAYTLVIGDAENIVELTNAAAIALTIPAEATVPFPTGTAIEIHQGGAGTVTVGPDAGVTLLSRGSVFDLAGQDAIAVIRKVAADTWRLTGDIA